jgi:hypothetical protein
LPANKKSGIIAHENMTLSPIQIFNSAHDRAEIFLERNPGKRAKDDLRAAAVFVVAAIDAYFSVKIVAHLKSEYYKNPSKFNPSLAARNLIKEQIAKRSFNNKDFKDLKKHEKELVSTLAESNKSSIISYLESAIKMQSFQAIEKIDEAFKIMGKNPPEIWNKVDSVIKSGKPSHKKKIGRPKRNKGGRKVDVRIQLENLFKRRHLIVHEADVVLRGRASVGKERQISYETVKKWLTYSQKSIKEIDKLIK